MTLPPIAPTVRVRRLDTNVVLGTSTVIDSLTITRGLDGEETLAVSLPLYTDTGHANDAAHALILASGGPDGFGVIVPALIEVSLDGGTSYDARKMAESPAVTLDGSQGATVHEQGQGLWAGYAKTLVDHVTFTGIPFSDLIAGQAGTSAAGQVGYDLLAQPTPAHPVSTQGIGTPDILNHLKGYAATTPGPPFSGSPTWTGQAALAFAVAVDSSLTTLAVDADEWASPIDQAVATACTAAAGIQAGVDPIGLHAHYTVDSSDTAAGNIVAGVDGTAAGGSLLVGYAGTTAALTFTDDTSLTDPSLAPDMTKAQILDPIDRVVQLSDAIAAVTLLGGASTHGLPDLASIVGVQVINTGVSTTAWNASLPIVAARTGQGAGGVYFLVGNTCYPFGQQLDIYDLALDVKASSPFLYAATGNGIYRAPATLSGTQSPSDALIAYDTAHSLPTNSWERIGGNTTTGTAGLVATCKKVIAQNAVIVAHATAGNVAGLFMHPALTGDTRGVQGGYDGWTSLHASSSIVDFSYTNDGTHDELVHVDADNATVVVFHTSVSSAGTSNPPVQQATPNGATITGIDSVPGGYVIRTLAGAAGLYFLACGGGSAMSAIGTGLVDSSNRTVIVNRVVPYPDPVTAGGAGIAGQLVYGFACTDAGLYYSTTALSSPTWKSGGLQTGLVDQNLLYVAAGRARTLINRSATCITAASDRSLFTSNSDGLYYEDLLADKVDLDAFWLALWQGSPDNTGGSFAPSTDVVAFANSADVPSFNAGTPYLGTPGVAKTIFSSAGAAVPTLTAWVSPLDERNNRTYRLTNFASPAPYFGIHAGEVPEIEATSSSPIGVASARLAQVAMRRLKEYSLAQQTLTLRSAFAFSTHSLRSLRPCQRVSVNFNRAAFGLSYGARLFYVLRHTISWTRDDPVARTETVLGSILRNTPPTDSEIAAALGTAVGKTARFGRTRRV